MASSQQQMRGLTQYIADLRACRVRELEEKRINKEMAHIRQKFKEGQLDGYQRRKYLAKIIFTYILGYNVDTGHMEAINLIASAKYSEKQIVRIATIYAAWVDLLTCQSAALLPYHYYHY